VAWRERGHSCVNGAWACAPVSTAAPETEALLIEYIFILTKLKG
jgi:hypothetical protein